MLCLISRLASDKLEKANNMSIKYYTLSFSSNIFGGGVNLSVGGGEKTVRRCTKVNCKLTSTNGRLNNFDCP